MRTPLIAFALFVLLVAGACNNQPETTAATPATQVETQGSTNLTPEELGELGARIERNPSDAQRILSERGLNEDSFEQAVRRVSEDPAASQRYTEAYRRARA